MLPRGMGCGAVLGEQVGFEAPQELGFVASDDPSPCNRSPLRGKPPSRYRVPSGGGDVNLRAVNKRDLMLISNKKVERTPAFGSSRLPPGSAGFGFTPWQ